MANWKEQLRPASFRGIAFGVTSADKEGGRRTVIHEFPQRDDVHVEDMGMATQRFTVEAFVLGPDYMSRRDALEDALNQPGPGTLVHPWYGEINVSQCAPYKVKHTATDGGMAVFTLAFAKDGEAKSPSAVVHPQSRAASMAMAARLQAAEAFSATMKLKGEIAFVLDAAKKSATAAVQRLQKAVDAPAADHISDLSAEGLLASVQSVAGASSLPQSSATLALLATVAEDPQTVNPEARGSVGQRVAANDLAINNFVRQLVFVESASTLATLVPDSRSQAKALREGFVASLDSLLADDMADGLYTALGRTRAATIAAMAENARSAPQVAWHTPAIILPSLVLCHQLTGAIATETDLVNRNRIHHPGFVPVQPLEVLIHE